MQKRALERPSVRSTIRYAAVVLALLTACQAEETDAAGDGGGGSGQGGTMSGAPSGGTGASAGAGAPSGGTGAAAQGGVSGATSGGSGGAPSGGTSAGLGGAGGATGGGAGDGASGMSGAAGVGAQAGGGIGGGGASGAAGMAGSGGNGGAAGRGGSGGELCASRTGGALIDMTVAGESLRLWFTNTAFINEMAQNVGREAPRQPILDLVDGRDCDPRWTWHANPANPRFAPAQMDTCASWPSDVENDKGTWLNTDWCPEMVQVVAVRRQ
jgi:hypothetical protein